MNKLPWKTIAKGMDIENAVLRAELAQAKRDIDVVNSHMGEIITANATRYRNAAIAQNYAIEQTLGMALYGKDAETGLPLWGDHTAETLAKEAVKAIAERDEALNDQLRWGNPMSCDRYIRGCGECGLNYTTDPCVDYRKTHALAEASKKLAGK